MDEAMLMAYTNKKIAESSGTYEQIQSITVPEGGLSEIVLIEEPDGTDYKFKNLIIDCTFQTGVASGLTVQAEMLFHMLSDTLNADIISETKPMFFRAYIGVENGLWITRIVSSDSIDPTICKESLNTLSIASEYPYCDSLLIQPTVGVIPAGSIIDVYGIRYNGVAISNPK